MKQVTLSIRIIFILLMIGSMQLSSAIAKNSQQSQSFNESSPVAHFKFDESLNCSIGKFTGAKVAFEKGLEGQALNLMSSKSLGVLTLDNKSLKLDNHHDFSVQFWLKTTVDSNKPFVLLSQKAFVDKSLASQKNPGWVLYSVGGTWAWNMGSGERRITYERENGQHMPLNDDTWHQLTMTYNKQLSEVRLYYDGQNKAVYKVGFDFVNDNPLVIGSIKNEFDYEQKVLPQIENGALLLQDLVDEFHAIGIGNLKNDEFLSLVVDPEELLEKKKNDSDPAKAAKVTMENLTKAMEIRNELLKNPYTVFQILELTELKPISKIYYLDDGMIMIKKEAAQSFTQLTQLFPSDMQLDNLAIWNRTLNAEDVLTAYNKFKNSTESELEQNIKSLHVGVWNIWHGGKHFTVGDDGWDSRLRIVEMIKEKELDVVLLQETYSSGDMIAAELGYYFAATTDWDYRFQGSNISVISRYPIKELCVPLDASFMNVGVKLAISQTQEIYAMSNWYGMQSFPIVYDFHQNRFMQADDIPVLFGGDFNAVPHTDGGESPASKKLLNAGFTDAFRNLYPDVQKYPGYSHENGVRIDQLYYKGQGLKNTSTETISTWPEGFPSDHFLIVSKFDLNYSSVKSK